MTGIFSHEHLNDLKRAVGVYARRHEVISENVANIDTQGYRAQEYRFEDLLSGAQARIAGTRTHQQHLAIGARGIDDTSGEVRETASAFDNGTNNVDIDHEMTDLATNDLTYRLTTRLLTMRYSMLRGAIRGRSV